MSTVIPRLENVPWKRKHDLSAIGAPRIVFPTLLEGLIQICKTRAPGERLKAAGSHWALSDAAISDHDFIETNDPNPELHPGTNGAMDRTLLEVVPGCLSAGFLAQLGARRLVGYQRATSDADKYDVEENIGPFFVHFETGKRIYQLYSEMDVADGVGLGDDLAAQLGGGAISLARQIERDFQNPDYLGPWGFPTLGGAGGQTVFGALTTGTHGGDFKLPPVADAVAAMHLVADGGVHYWIEPSPGEGPTRMTDDDKLKALYGDAKFGGPDNFRLVRDSNLFAAVLISPGRFGIVYSVVLSVVRQYSLHQERRLTNWQDVNDANGVPVRGVRRTLDEWQKNGGPLSDAFFSKPSDTKTNHDDKINNRFVQAVVCLTPYDFFAKNLCAVTKHWNVRIGADQVVPNGRRERSGANAGTSDSYNPDPDHPPGTPDELPG